MIRYVLWDSFCQCMSIEIVKSRGHCLAYVRDNNPVGFSLSYKSTQSRHTMERIRAKKVPHWLLEPAPPYFRVAATGIRSYLL